MQGEVEAHAGPDLPGKDWQTAGAAMQPLATAGGRTLVLSEPSPRVHVAVSAAPPPVPRDQWTAAGGDLTILSGGVGPAGHGAARRCGRLESGGGERRTLRATVDGAPAIVALAADGDVIGAAAQAAPILPLSIGQLIQLAAPLLLGGTAILLLLRHSMAQTKAGLALDESERRFRLAVEAARCGIWEWDLRDDRMFMSDVTGAMLGWGGGGRRRDRARCWTASPPNTATGCARPWAPPRPTAPSTSPSACPTRPAAPVWIDARGQAFGEPRTATATPASSAWRWTSPRSALAQARAQAAETRLRDAIESVSEAFVLWDRAGPAADVQQELPHASSAWSRAC